MTREEFDKGRVLWEKSFSEIFGGITEEERLKRLFPNLTSGELIRYGNCWDVKNMYPPHVEYYLNKLKQFPDLALMAFVYEGPNRSHFNGRPVPCYKELVLRELMRRSEFILLGVHNE